MEEKKCTPTSSTPGFWRKGSVEKPKVTPGVPSPVLTSELTENNKSTILESSGIEDCSTTVQYDPSMDDTTIQDLPASQTPIAGRTRSHDGSMAPSMTSFRIGMLKEALKNGIAQSEQQDDEETYSMVSEDIKIIEGNPLNESKYQIGYMTDIKETKSLLSSMTTLDESHKTIKEILNRDDIEENMQEFRSFNNNLMGRARDIVCPERFKSEISEVEEIKG